MSPEAWSIKSILEWSIRFLQKKDTDVSRLDLELLLGHVCGLKRIELYTNYDLPLKEHEHKAFGQLFRRRLNGEPVAYLLGKKGFMHDDFEVNSDVLIPRPETELLVERSIEVLGQIRESQKLDKLRVLEIGVGSACISGTIAKLCPWLEIEAWDISAPAIEVAKKNLRSLGVGERVFLKQVDVFKFDFSSAQGRYDFILSNPPYVADDGQGLQETVERFEPSQALFGGQDGLDFYKLFAQHLLTLLKPYGVLALEFGDGQAPMIKSIFENFDWQDIQCMKDYANIDRVLTAQRPSQG